MNPQSLLNQMTLEEKIGQLFMLAFSGHRLDEALILMRDRLVGGAYISNENVPDPLVAINLTNELQSYATNTPLKIPLLLGVDQEGAWSVMTPGSSPGPGNMAIGATADPQYAYDMYAVIAQELKAVGLNTLLAPCADCNSNSYNVGIGMRSFGESPQLVGEMTAAAVRGAQDNGVLATVKHFPGHGDTTLDSHRGLPIVNRPLADLHKIDLHPFAEGIKAGVGMVMTAHIIFPAIDSENPATLSPAILKTLLRDEMGFEGVVLSDSMNMKAMKRHFDPRESLVRALNAGVDLIMLAEEHYDHDANQYLANQLGLVDAVKAAIQNGTLTEDRVNEAVRRVLELKAKYGFTTDPITDQAAALSQVGGQAQRAVELNVARHAVAVLRDENGLLPLSPDTPIILVNTTDPASYRILGETRGIGPNQTTPAYHTFAEAMQAAFGDSLTTMTPAQATDSIPTNATIVAVTENYPLPGVDFDQTQQIEVVNQFATLYPDRLIVVGLRDPYEIAQFSGVKCYVCAFSFRPSAAQAAADVLIGRSKAYGRTPVSVPL